MTDTIRRHAAAAAILADAAGLIRVNGYHRDDRGHDFWPNAFRDPWRPGLPLDITAAIYVSRGWTTYNEIIAAVSTPGCGRWPDVDPAVDALLAYTGLPGRTDDALHDFWRWEDEHTDAELIAALEGCAASLRAVAAA